MKFVITVLILISVPAMGFGQQEVFTETFENGLSLWVGKYSGLHSGVIVQDPLDSSNQVLAFTSTTACGDVFSPLFEVNSSSEYLLKFDYLGQAKSGSPDGDFGGVIGISDDTPGNISGFCTVAWLAATVDNVGDNFFLELIDDGQWHSYVIPFDPFAFQQFVIVDNFVRVAIEDWNSSGSELPVGVSGDVYFDNVQVVSYDAVGVEAGNWGAIKVLYR